MDWVKAKVREIKGTDQYNFTKVVADWVNDMNVTIKKRERKGRDFFPDGGRVQYEERTRPKSTASRRGAADTRLCLPSILYRNQSSTPR
jgi:hypothetical protein